MLNPKLLARTWTYMRCWIWEGYGSYIRLRYVSRSSTHITVTQFQARSNAIVAVGYRRSKAGRVGVFLLLRGLNCARVYSQEYLVQFCYRRNLSILTDGNDVNWCQKQKYCGLTALLGDNLARICGL